MKTPTLHVRDILQDRILISRESARLLEEPMRGLVREISSKETAACEYSLAIDFQGVEGIAPSFVDELIRIFESLVNSPANGAARRLVVMNPPTRLSSKFEAIARSHSLMIEVLPNGAWSLSESHKSEN